MPAPSLTSADIATRLEEAQAIEEAAADRLRSLRVAAVAADQPNSSEEQEAAADLAKAREGVERLETALQATQAAERAQARRLALADRDARDRATLATFDGLEKAALAFDGACQAYAKTWARLLEASDRCQTELRERQGVIRRDLAIPPLAPLAQRYLAVLSPPDGRTAPGANIAGQLRDHVTPLTDVLGSLAAAAKADINAARQPVEA